MKMWIGIAGALGQVPPGFPEQVEVPQPFLGWINTPFWVWLVRAALAAGLILCLWYIFSAHKGQGPEGPGPEQPPAEPVQKEKEKQ